MSLEFDLEKEKKAQVISVRLDSSQAKDLAECAVLCGFHDESEYIRAALYFAKPIMLRLKNNPGYVLRIISEMVKVN